MAISESDKKNGLMLAVEKLFSVSQFHEITLDDVIREAGVGKGTVYRYFKDKDDLFFQTALAGFEEMCVQLDTIDFAGLSAYDGILTACRTISDFFRRRKPLVHMILAQDERTRVQGGGLRTLWLRERKKLTGALADIIARGVAVGYVRADIPPLVLSEYLMGMLRTRANEIGDMDETWQRHEILVDLFLRGAHGNSTAEL